MAILGFIHHPAYSGRYSHINLFDYSPDYSVPSPVTRDGLSGVRFRLTHPSIFQISKALAVPFALPRPPHPLPLVPVPLLLLQRLGLIPLLRNRQRIPRRIVIFGKYA